MGAHAVGIFVGDFVPVFHLLNVVSLSVHTSIDPVFAFMVVLSAGRSGPAHHAEGQRGGDSRGRQNSRRSLGHGFLLSELAWISLTMANGRR